MSRYQVVIKRIVSVEGKTIAEAKSVAMTSGDGGNEISQSISVNISSGNSSSSSSKSSSSSCTKKYPSDA